MSLELKLTLKAKDIAEDCKLLRKAATRIAKEPTTPILSIIVIRDDSEKVVGEWSLSPVKAGAFKV